MEIIAGGKKIDTKSVTSGGTGFSDYQLNIRALDAGDKAHQSLPYTFQTWEFQDTVIANNTTEDNSLTADPDDDRYITSVELEFTDSIEFMNQLNQGIIIWCYKGTDLLFSRSHSAKEVRSVYDGSNYVLTVAIVPKLAWRIPAGTDFKVTYGNNTGNSIDQVDGTIQYMQPS